MSYEEKYFAIRDEIKHLIQIDSRMSGIQEIIFGEKERVGALKFPCLFIIPGRTSDEDVEMPNEQELKHLFQLVFVLKDTDIQEGLEQAIKYGGRSYDIFMKENRDLNGKALYCTVKTIDPGYGRADQAILHWCEVELEVTALM